MVQIDLELFIWPMERQNVWMESWWLMVVAIFNLIQFRSFVYFNFVTSRNQDYIAYEDFQPHRQIMGVCDENEGVDVAR